MLRVHFSVQHTDIDFVDVPKQCIIQLPLLYSALWCILYFFGERGYRRVLPTFRA